MDINKSTINGKNDTDNRLLLPSNIHAISEFDGKHRRRPSTTFAFFQTIATAWDTGLCKKTCPKARQQL